MKRLPGEKGPIVALARPGGEAAVVPSLPRAGSSV